MTRFEPPAHQTRSFFPRRRPFCVCVIVWNEGDRLRRQLERMRPLAGIADIIIADGDSADGSTEPAYLESMGVRALVSTPERGLSTATRLALAFALDEGYEGVVTIDGNGKDGVEALENFLAELRAGFDLVQGSRFMAGGAHQNTPLSRSIGIRWVLAPLIAIGSGFRYTDPTNAFRAMSRRFLLDPRLQPVRREFVNFSLQHYLIVRAPRLGFRVREIPVERHYPDGGGVPTKIRGIGGHLAVLTDLIGVLRGRFNP